MSFRLLEALFLVLVGHSLVFSEELTLEVYRDIVSEYRSGSFRGATERFVAFDREAVGARNDELPRTLDLTRLDEQRMLRAATLLNAEAARIAGTPGRVHFYLNEAMRLSSWFGEDAHELRRRFHLALAYSLYSRHRVGDALRVLEPAARHYDTDPDIQFAFGTLTELSGWLNSRASLLEQAADAYRKVVEHRPDHARALVRLGRVLVLLGEHESALSVVQAGLDRGVPIAERVVGLLSLGDVLRTTSTQAQAIEAYRDARSVDPESQAVNVALANALWVNGQIDEARALVAETFAINDRASDDSLQDYMMGDSSSHFALWSLLRESFEGERDERPRARNDIEH